MHTLSVLLALAPVSALAQAPIWGQCTLQQPR